MPFRPDPVERRARALADLRLGVPVVLGGETGALVLAAEAVRPERLTELRKMGGAPVLAITGRRAVTLRARAYDEDIARVVLPPDAGCAWVRAVADPAGDLDTPMKGPLKTLRDGSAETHRAAIALVKAARLLPAALVLPLENAAGFAAANELTRLELPLPPAITPAYAPVAAARLPMEAAERGRLHVYRPGDGGEEHYAVEIGQPPRDGAPLVRLHSACFTGDVLGSLKCDCGPQLHAALDQMGAAQQGVLLYLNQEGRGIGLANKMRAYSLQDQGFDTVEANHRLGFEDDERDFRIGAEILKRLGFSRIRLLTNNPNKVARMQEAGIAVEARVPLKVGEGLHNHHYLATKAAKSGHLL
ncbi:GTP cyclohydrolase II [Limimaricola hongkongensis]|uniref:GTP cyclohydrolase-2 n=1 Tax=Limimaricola hongkongensis DSM 17492 TaxID=1122180 RepID=A0A017HF58_9RHOB|nr:GTP cyclohydrolase II [Limimaricola hongkongensis]EYD72986.1 3,4-dihydroxy-2-butanone 4-phosphate synthase / GTP cyclohydrolase II [Limimaricola hongkongensis DSM 17492]